MDNSVDYNKATVTMPLTMYNDLEWFKDHYNQLRAALLNTAYVNMEDKQIEVHTQRFEQFMRDQLPMADALNKNCPVVFRRD